MTKFTTDEEFSFRQPLAAELTKLLALRATWIISMATLVLSACIVLLSYSGISMTADERGLSAESIRALMLVPAYLFIGVAVVTSASEYRNGQIRISYIAVPKRVILYSAKLCGLLIVVAPLAMLLSAIGLLAKGTPPAESGSADLVHAAVASLLVLTLLSLVGFGLAIITRSAVVSLVTLWALAALVAPTLRASMPSVIHLLPHDLALQVLVIPAGVPNDTPQSAAILLLSAWAIVCLIVAGVLFARRDS
ncbi:hypothetical protein [Cryobacterium sp. Y50]|uniref:hypothetical protein n=1 Tax=Cryobacterium sp. Y50 TaxID=2048286 RepID=UPI000CE42328|nr:hypothetical protein [Cryobacterium sp. Y50]